MRPTLITLYFTGCSFFFSFFYLPFCKRRTAAAGETRGWRRWWARLLLLSAAPSSSSWVMHLKTAPRCWCTGVWAESTKWQKNSGEGSGSLDKRSSENKHPRWLSPVEEMERCAAEKRWGGENLKMASIFLPPAKSRSVGVMSHINSICR